MSAIVPLLEYKDFFDTGPMYRPVFWSKNYVSIEDSRFTTGVISPEYEIKRIPLPANRAIIKSAKIGRDSVDIERHRREKLNLGSLDVVICDKTSEDAFNNSNNNSEYIYGRRGSIGEGVFHRVSKLRVKFFCMPIINEIKVQKNMFKSNSHSTYLKNITMGSGNLKDVLDLLRSCKVKNIEDVKFYMSPDADEVAKEIENCDLRGWSKCRYRSGKDNIRTRGFEMIKGKLSNEYAYKTFSRLVSLLSEFEYNIGENKVIFKNIKRGGKNHDKKYFDPKQKTKDIIEHCVDKFKKVYCPNMFSVSDHV